MSKRKATRKPTKLHQMRRAKRCFEVMLENHELDEAMLKAGVVRVAEPESDIVEDFEAGLESLKRSGWRDQEMVIGENEFEALAEAVKNMDECGEVKEITIQKGATPGPATIFEELKELTTFSEKEIKRAFAEKERIAADHVDPIHEDEKDEPNQDS